MTHAWHAQARRQLLRKQRGDEKTFVSESRAYTLESHGDNPVATAFRTGEHEVVMNASSCPNFKRANLAGEFDVVHIYFVPTRYGVVEYGTPK